MSRPKGKAGGPLKPCLPGLAPDASEQQHQEWLAKWLDAKGLCWWHTPNEGKRNIRVGAKLKRAGMKSGVPDVIIVSKAPDAPWARGVAIELKKPKGKGAKGRLTPAQRTWLCRLEEEGWAVTVAFGWQEAVDWLERLGY
tara:strand:+ start:1600 stop:2019 length:420 start_codon:yes stop_codon:yes gene_type:complete